MEFMKRYCFFTDFDEFIFQGENLDYESDNQNQKFGEILSYNKKKSLTVRKSNKRVFFSGYEKLPYDLQSNIEDLQLFLQNEIFHTNEFDLDMLEETRLMLSCMSQEKVKQFDIEIPECIYNDTGKLCIRDKTEQNCIYEAVINRMKDNINNTMKKNSKEEVSIFCYSSLSTSKKKKIDSFGSGIYRFWFYSREFRNLVVETDGNTKYEIKHILEIIDDAEKKGIVFDSDDAVILEKLLGIQTGILFYRYILADRMNDQGKISYESEMKDLLHCILDYEGQHIKWVLIRYIGNILNVFAIHGKNNLKEYIEPLIKILNQNSKNYNKTYEVWLSDILKNIAGQFTIKTAKELIESEIRKKYVLDEIYLTYENTSWLVKYGLYYTDMSIIEKAIVKDYCKSFKPSAIQFQKEIITNNCNKHRKI